MKLQGISVSEGLAIAKVFKLEEVEFDTSDITNCDVDAELKKYTSAVENVIVELDKHIESMEGKLKPEEIEIFNAHKLIANDPQMSEEVQNLIKENHGCAYATETVMGMYITMFENMEDEYMKGRAIDIRDVKEKLLGNILNIKLPSLSEISEEVIVVAEDLTPSQTSSLNLDYVKGFITKIGSKTSHSAIIAKNLQIPAISSIDVEDEVFTDCPVIVLNGYNGEVIVNPSTTELEFYDSQIKSYENEKKLLESYLNAPSVTHDGKSIFLKSNIGSPNDLDKVIKNGADGIGLFRTEFLYMENNNFPTEDEQRDAYYEVLSKMHPKPVTIRTLDIGGDKKLNYFELPEELNPFLGVRAIRLCFENESIFKTQIRAMLRANKYGNLRIMFPMIATIEEFLKAKEFVSKCEQELINEGKIVAKYMVGIMVEVPSVAVSADNFAKYVDFFSIGTNDLVQYTFAADRMNDSLNYLYKPLHPSVIKLLSTVINAGRKYNIPVGMCGELAGSKEAFPLLLGLGLEEYSMSSGSIPKIRKLASEINYYEAMELANEISEYDREKKVLSRIEEFLGK